LMALINTVVHGLWHIDTLVPILLQLGQRHVGYGTQTAHYDMVGAALLWTLRQRLGAQFTAEVEAAWATAYTFIATTMLTGAGQVAETPDLLEP
jgi:hemoglobin-like flavoprotein